MPSIYHLNVEDLRAPPRHYPPVAREHDALQSRHPDTDIGRPDRPRGSGHDLVHPYPDKFRRDDHMDVDPPPFSSRVSQYEEPARPRDLGNRPSSHSIVVPRETIPPTARPRRRDSFNVRPTTPVGSGSIITEKIRGRSRDRSPRSYRQSTSVPLTTIPPGLPRDTLCVDDYRHQEPRRVDREREVSVLLRNVNWSSCCVVQGHSPILPRNSSSAIVSRSQPAGRYNEPGGMKLRCLFSVPMTNGCAVLQANVTLYVAVLKALASH